MERGLVTRQLDHLKIEAEQVAETGSDDFDNPAVASRVRREAGLRPATPDELRAAAERSLDEAGVTGAERDKRLAAVDRALGSLA